MSAGTVSEILKNSSFFLGHPIKIQNLKDYQIIERYNFSIETLKRDDHFFETIVFTDECKFQTNPDSTVNNFVGSFQLRLQLCSRLGGKSIVSYLKKRQYKNPQQFLLEEPQYIFDLITDLKLLEYKKQSWKKLDKKWA